MSVRSDNVAGQAVPSPQEPLPPPPAEQQPAAKNHGGISEIMFFAGSEGPDRTKPRHEPHALEMGIILIAILLSIAAYFWIEKSNVVKKLGEPVAMKQKQAAPQPTHQAANSNFKPAEASPAKEITPIKIEPPEMSRPEPPSVVVSQPSAKTASKARTRSARLARTKHKAKQESPVTPIIPLSVGQHPIRNEPDNSAHEVSTPPVAEPAPAVEPAPHDAQAPRHASPESRPRATTTAQSGSHKDHELGTQADPVKIFFDKWRESIQKGTDKPTCTAQARSLNQCS